HREGRSAGRRASARASAPRSSASGWRTSTGVERRLRRRAGSTSSRAGPSLQEVESRVVVSRHGVELTIPTDSTTPRTYYTTRGGRLSPNPPPPLLPLPTCYPVGGCVPQSGVFAPGACVT